MLYHIILHSPHLFDIPLDSWSLLVALGFVVGIEFAERALNSWVFAWQMLSMRLFIVGMGFVVGHFVHVGVYNPHMIDQYGWVIFCKCVGFPAMVALLERYWARGCGLHSFVNGSILEVCRYNLSLPFGWFFGRLGCFSAHDHIAAGVTSFWLSIFRRLLRGPVTIWVCMKHCGFSVWRWFTFRCVKRNFRTVLLP